MSKEQRAELVDKIAKVINRRTYEVCGLPYYEELGTWHNYREEATAALDLAIDAAAQIAWRMTQDRKRGIDIYHAIRALKGPMQ